jgi:hypothetical protein
VQSPWEKPLLVGAFVLVLALGLAASVSFAVLLGRPAAAETLSTLPSNPWWLIYSEPGRRNGAQPLWIIAATAAATVVGLIASLRVHSLHRNSRTPVLPYLLLFFLSLGTECLRGATAVLFAANRLIPASFVLTRAVYWGRYVGLFALLLSSLYCIEMKYRHIYALGGGALLLALALAANIPLDESTFLSQFTWKLGDGEGVWFTDTAIAALVLATTAGAAVIKRDKRFLALAGGFLLLLAARELLFFSVLPLPLASGIAALAAGAAVCLRTLARIYGER